LTFAQSLNETMNKSPLTEGLSDALGFITGAILGYLAGLLLGLNAMAPGYGNSTIAGMVLVGLGGGLGVKRARRWQARRKKTRDGKAD
jgi:uncharacterized oligopeptide transporter (OPT) family protein